MKKRPVIRAAAALFAAILAISFCSCGKRYDDGEIIAAAKELIEKSEEINRIFFGDGLQLADEDDYAELYPWIAPAVPAENGGEENDMTYYMVKPDCGYSSTDDIKKATLSVFTEDYSEILFSNAFSGISVVVGSGDQAEKQLVSLARYIDSDDGYLAARIPTEEEKLPLGRVYDLESVSVVSQRGTEAKIEVSSTSPDGGTEVIELNLKITADGWRLDTPTY